MRMMVCGWLLVAWHICVHMCCIPVWLVDTKERDGMVDGSRKKKDEQGLRRQTGRGQWAVGSRQAESRVDTAGVVKLGGQVVMLCVVKLCAEQSTYVTVPYIMRKLFELRHSIVSIGNGYEGNSNSRPGTYMPRYRVMMWM